MTGRRRRRKWITRGRKRIYNHCEKKKEEKKNEKYPRTNREGNAKV